MKPQLSPLAWVHDAVVARTVVRHGLRAPLAPSIARAVMRARRRAGKRGQSWHRGRHAQRRVA